MLCTNCRKREARYLRPTSGEVLCEKCLSNGVYKQIRKFFTLYNVVNRGSSVAFIVRHDRIAESLEVLRISNRLLKHLTSKRIVVVPKGSKAIDFLKHWRIDADIVEYEIVANTESIIEYIKLLDMIAKDICTEKRINTALLPLFRDELTLIMILGLLESAPHVFSDAMPVKRFKGLKIARLTYYVFSSDIVALTYMNGLYESIDTPKSFKITVNRRELIVLKHIYPIIWRSRELMYSSRKSLELLQSVVLANKGICGFCLARSNEDPCPTCRRLIAKYQQGLYRTSG